MNLLRPSYHETSTRLLRNIGLCNEIYEARSDKGELLAFFKVGYHKIRDFDCCFLGLSACKDEYKKNGIVKKLYLEMCRDCIHKELNLNKRIVLYWTTATPIVYYWTNNYFTNVKTRFIWKLSGRR